MRRERQRGRLDRVKTHERRNERTVSHDFKTMIGQEATVERTTGVQITENGIPTYTEPGSSLVKITGFRLSQGRTIVGQLANLINEGHALAWGGTFKVLEERRRGRRTCLG